MTALRTGKISPQMIVLGLVIQQPDTAAGVGRRMADQFASARFSKNAAHQNFPSLARKGYMRVVEKSRSGEWTQDRYEGTPQGIEHFRKWLRSRELPPIVRDALQYKLEFFDVRLDDLAALVRTIRDEERAYADACSSVQAEVLSEQRVRRRSKKPVDWRAKLRGIQKKDEAALLTLLTLRLERLGDSLEQLLDEISAGEAD